MTRIHPKAYAQFGADWPLDRGNLMRDGRTVAIHASRRISPRSGSIQIPSEAMDADLHAVYQLYAEDDGTESVRFVGSADKGFVLAYEADKDGKRRITHNALWNAVSLRADLDGRSAPAARENGHKPAIATSADGTSVVAYEWAEDRRSCRVTSNGTTTIVYLTDRGAFDLNDTRNVCHPTIQAAVAAFLHRGTERQRGMRSAPTEQRAPVPIKDRTKRPAPPRVS